MSDATPVRFLTEGAVARIVLSRPDRGNAIDLPMAERLREIAVECDIDAAIRCVVLSGEGRLFCGGGDVRHFAAAGAAGPRLVKSITAHLHSAIATFARMAKPLVTVVNGPAAGAGVGLAALGDIAIASRAAHFTLAYSSIGLTPDAGATWLLPRLLGLRRAQELLLINRRLTADEAAAAGLISRAVDHERLWEEAHPIIATLASGATAALGRTRQLLLSGFGSTLETQLEEEARAIIAALATSDGIAGVTGFVAGRSPSFAGR